MNNLRRRFERFCFQNRNKGISNLMLYVALGSGLVYLIGMITNNNALYYALCFDRDLILQGQLWRLITYIFTYGYGDPQFILVAIGLLCYYSIGGAMENIWGTLRFNLFYLCGIVLQDVFCLLFGGWATVDNLNLSLFLSYATLFPNASFLLFFIIPIKAWILGVFYIGIMAYQVITNTVFGFFPYSLYPLVALLNYFLFFGKDFINVFPVSWRINASRLFRKKRKYAPQKDQPKVIPFTKTGSYQADVAKPEAPYTHKCTVCGRTDVSNPELEFRYCSRCNGYFCYCEDHISNHTHVE